MSTIGEQTQGRTNWATPSGYKTNNVSSIILIIHFILIQGKIRKLSIILPFILLFRYEIEVCHTNFECTPNKKSPSWVNIQNTSFFSMKTKFYFQIGG